MGIGLNSLEESSIISETKATKAPVKILERLTPKDLVRKHISDRTHKITQEEFNKLIVGVFASDFLKDKKPYQ